MRGKNRGGIADGEIDLTLCEILDMPQVRTCQICARQDGVIKICMVKNCATQVRVCEVRPIQSRVGEVGF